MLGAIVGDIIGVPYEFNSTKDYNFPLHPLGKRKPPTFSDDTVLTVAVADTLMHNKPLTSDGYVENFHKYVRAESRRGYGPRFKKWVQNGEKLPYNSFGNGSAMRVSPVAWFHDNDCDVLLAAEQSAAVTHDHPEGIKGAKATALAIFMARCGYDKADIKRGVVKISGYDLDRKYDDIKLFYKFDVTCQGSVPEAIICFLESTDYMDCVRRAVALGGDADTQAAISGSIAEAFYKTIPQDQIDFAMDKLPDSFKAVVEEFDRKYVQPKKLA